MKINPCKDCGNTNITFDDCNYSSFNYGGGECTKCGNKAYKLCSTFPKKQNLISTWNSENKGIKMLEDNVLNSSNKLNEKFKTFDKLINNVFSLEDIKKIEEKYKKLPIIDIIFFFYFLNIF